MDMIVSLLSLTACAALAWRSYRSHQITQQRTAIMAAAWLGIFIVLVFSIQRLGLAG